LVFGYIPDSPSAVFFKLVCDAGLFGTGLLVPLACEDLVAWLLSLAGARVGVGTGEAAFGVVAELEGCEPVEGVWGGDDAAILLSIARRFWRIYKYC
jgi:hypothetical protein